MDEQQKSINDLERLYQAGNYGTARKLAKQISENPLHSDEAKKRAAQILKATGIDPVVVAAFLLTAGVLAFLIVRYLV